jgi:geranylgeranyl diphosphate synthase, type II
MLMELDSYLAKTTPLIEKHLEILVQEQEVPFNNLYQAARYSLLGGAKRIRPLLVLATCETFQGDLKLALHPACALEMIHTYSLIHDDLPCMDDDDYRRGKLSLHKAFTEGEAVLTGDYLLTYAFEVLVDSPGLTTEQKLRMISLLSRKSGAKGMIGGQIMDIQNEKDALSLENLSLRHRYKTGALIEASIGLGGIIANVSVEHMKSLEAFGSDIGLAFQIVDDILDVTQGSQKHGKAIGSDIANKKTTYVTYFGLEKAKKTAENLLASSLSHLNHLPCHTPLLSKLATFIVERQF